MLSEGHPLLVKYSYMNLRVFSNIHNKLEMHNTDSQDSRNSKTLQHSP
jgi:hypothetical protein